MVQLDCGHFTLKCVGSTKSSPIDNVEHTHMGKVCKHGGVVGIGGNMRWLNLSAMSGLDIVGVMGEKLTFFLNGKVLHEFGFISTPPQAKQNVFAKRNLLNCHTECEKVI